MECEDSRRQEFGEQRVADLLGRVAEQDPAALLEELFGALRRFSGGREQKDDACALAIKRLPAHLGPAAEIKSPFRAAIHPD
jgi:serine phosphatase RsbU (regulator of sigma subunit)